MSSFLSVNIKSKLLSLASGLQISTWYVISPQPSFSNCSYSPHHSSLIYYTSTILSTLGTHGEQSILGPFPLPEMFFHQIFAQPLLPHFSDQSKCHFFQGGLFGPLILCSSSVTGYHIILLSFIIELIFTYFLTCLL